MGRFCLSAGATLGSRAPISLSESPSIRANGLVASTEEIPNLEENLQRPLTCKSDEFRKIEGRTHLLGENIPV